MTDLGREIFMKTALIPGSFDPITMGHLNVIERASRIFDRVVVAVMMNDSAKYADSLSSKSYMFTIEERLEMVKEAIADIENAEAISNGGMLIDLFDEVGADAVVRGIRNSADLEYEMIHASWNKEHNERFEAVFLPTAPELENISSTEIRRLITSKDCIALDGKVPKAVINFIKKV